MKKQRKRWPMRACLVALGMACIWPVWADTRPAGRVTTFICNGTEWHGKLIALTLSSRANPAELDVSDNRLPLSVLYKISANWPEGADWRLQPQGDTIRVLQDELLDLRSEMTLGGTATDWSLQGADGSTVSETVYTMQSGRLKIHEAGVYRLVLSNTRVTDGRGGVGNQIVFTRTIIVSALPEKVVKSAGRVTTFICNGAEQNGKVTGLTLSSHADLSVLDLSDNRVPLSALYKMSLKRPEGADWRLHPQSGAINILSDGSLDLRSELTIGKTATDWQLQYEDGTDVPDSYYVMQNGYLQIHEAGVYRLVLANDRVTDSRGGVVGAPVVFTKAISVDWAFGLGKRDGHILSFACNGAEHQSAMMSLDVRDCASLKYLHCDSNRLTSLDLSQNLALTQLSCYNNLRVVDLDADNSLALDTLPGMDVSRIGSVTGGYIEGTRLFFNAQEVTYRYATHFPGEASLGFDTVEFTLVAAQPPVTPPDEPEEPTYVACDTITWTWTAEAGEEKRIWIEGDVNERFVIDWGDDTQEEIIGRGYSQRYWPWYPKDSADITHVYSRTATYRVVLYGVTPQGKLTGFSCDQNHVTSLDVSHSLHLEHLYCGYNDLTTLDVSQNTTLLELFCTNNALTSLDVSYNTALFDLCCGKNQLTTLDVSNNRALKTLLCDGNQLTMLDVSNNLELSYLQCGENQLDSLDLSRNERLNVLYCENGQLKSLNIPNTCWSDFRCYGNRLPFSEVAVISERAIPCSSREWSSLEPQYMEPIAMGLEEGLSLSDYLLEIKGKKCDMVVMGQSYDTLVLDYDYIISNDSLYFNKPGQYRMLVWNDSVIGKWSHGIPRVYVATYHITVVGDPIDPDPIVPDTIVPENGAGWIWQANAGEEKEIEFKGTGKGFRVDWGDGSTSDSKGAASFGEQSSVTKDSEKELKHRYAAEGVYTVKVAPLSSQGRLTFLDVSDERVQALSFGDVSMLEELYCSENMLLYLDLNGAQNLKKLDCSENALSDFDLSSCVKLQEIDFSENRLKKLELPNHSSLKEVDGEDNRLPLSSLHELLSKRAAKATYEFTPQGDSATLTAGQTLDLSSEMHLGGKNTTYTLRYADGRLASLADYTESNGIFRFMETGRSYTLSMENAAVTEYENGKAMQPITFVWHITVSGVGNEGNAPETAWVRAYVQERTIYLKSDFDLGQVCVYTVAGQRIYQGYSREITVPQAGVYLVVTGSYRLKVPVLR